MAYILFVVGIYLLVKCSEMIVEGSSSLAKRLGVSSMIVGLTVVAFGTSLPELVVNIFATFSNSPEIVYGNILGSNISNIFLVLGISAIVFKKGIKIPNIWNEVPFALFSAVVLLILTSKLSFSGDPNYLTRMNGVFLLSIFVLFIYYVFQRVRKGKGKDLLPDKKISEKRSSLKILLGLIGIYFAGKWIVGGVTTMATYFGIGEFFISATVIAVGTSLPELAVSISAVLRGQEELAVGNVIGSNIFNVLFVLGIVPIIRPLAIPSYVFFDVLLMVIATLILIVFMFVGKKNELTRKEGIILVLLYLAYIAYLIIFRS